jgi:hypothetical protein
MSLSTTLKGFQLLDHSLADGNRKTVKSLNIGLLFAVFDPQLDPTAVHLALSGPEFFVLPPER